MNWEPSAWQRGGNSATILGIIRKNAVHASLKGDGRFTGMPRMMLRLRYRTLKLRALMLALA
jgi:hypothetical protein